MLAGTAVSVGKELVSRLILTDPALCAERPVCSSWGHMGGDGDYFTLLFLVNHENVNKKCVFVNFIASAAKCSICFNVSSILSPYYGIRPMLQTGLK